MNKKNEIQKDIIKSLIDNNMRGIMLSSVRSGKTRILLTAIKEDWNDKYHEMPKVLILYPNIDIKNSWEKEMELISYFPDVTFSTFVSVEKVVNNKYDYIIVDEAHLLAPDTQLIYVGMLSNSHKHIILASGTYTDDTLRNIKNVTALKQIVNYSTEKAIEDGIVNNFTIYVHQYRLNQTKINEYGKVKKWKSTDKKEINRLTNKLNQSYGENLKFAALNRMRFINSSDSLITTVKQWITINSNKRFLLFAPDEKTGMKYSIPMFNSKSVSDKNLTDFQCGKINQLCLIKKASAGVTFPNLSTILITSINSNGETLEQIIGRSLLDDTESSDIHIFVSDEEFQIKWLNKSLENINKEKIKINQWQK
jgi:superfamily II DNA or RNA helicase